MKKGIVIPAYLRFSRPETLPSSEGLELTRRAIQSLNLLEDQDFTLILPVSFHSMEGGGEASLFEMDRSLREELRVLRKGKTFLFSNLHLQSLKRSLERRGFKALSSSMDLNGFSNIRNVGLFLAHALSMEVVLFIDNDEVVEDPCYLRIACEYLNERWEGVLISGKGGFYLDPNGEILLSSPNLWWRILWNKTRWMNKVWKRILASKDRFVHSPMLLGGNLVLHRHLFSQIPFDPFIPRGEDTDYLINASQMGFSILFDKELKIKHLHPPRTEVYFYEELRGDIERFLYERDKVRKGLRISLDPYPGSFLRGTLYPKAFLTALLLAIDYCTKGEWKKGIACLDLIRLLFQKREQTWMRYLTFCAHWGKAMENLQEMRGDPLLEQGWV